MRLIQLALSAMSLAMGCWLIWFYVHATESLTRVFAAMPENLAYLGYASMFFVAPALGWYLRPRSHVLVAVAVAALPLLVAVMTGSIRIRIE